MMIFNAKSQRRKERKDVVGEGAGHYTRGACAPRKFF